MLQRIAYHYVGIKTETEKKYRLLSEIQRNGHPVEFDVLYYAQCKRHNQIVEEIGRMEGELIRKYRPVLNTQIPKEENWRSWDEVDLDAREVLRKFL